MCYFSKQAVYSTRLPSFTPLVELECKIHYDGNTLFLPGFHHKEIDTIVLQYRTCSLVVTLSNLM